MKNLSRSFFDDWRHDSFQKDRACRFNRYTKRNWNIGNARVLESAIVQNRIARMAYCTRSNNIPIPLITTVDATKPPLNIAPYSNIYQCKIINPFALGLIESGLRNRSSQALTSVILRAKFISHLKLPKHRRIYIHIYSLHSSPGTLSSATFNEKFTGKHLPNNVYLSNTLRNPRCPENYSTQALAPRRENWTKKKEKIKRDTT